MINEDPYGEGWLVKMRAVRSLPSATLRLLRRASPTGRPSARLDGRST